LDVLFFCFFKSTGVNKNEEIFPRKWINPFIHLWRKPIVQGSESISGKKNKNFPIPACEPGALSHGHHPHIM
jgi:hypothetical protein